MRLTLEDLIVAVQSARNLEKLQADLRTAMIEHLIGQSPAPEISGGSQREFV